MATILRVNLIDSDGQVIPFVPESSIPPPPPPPPPDPGEEVEVPATPPDPALTPGTWFQVFQVHSGAALPGQDHGAVLWTFNASRTPLADPPVIPANLPWGHRPGQSRWNDLKDNPPGAVGADRISYHTAYFFLQHTEQMTPGDTSHHGYLDAIRFQFQDYGATNQVNDRHMMEDPFGAAEPGESQGLAPYPYERVKPAPIIRNYPGAVVLVKHRRVRKLANGATSVRNQLLRRIVIPATDPTNSRTKWWYQLNGLVVATNQVFVKPDNPDGVIAKLIIAGTHPAYSYEVEGISTAGV